ncbi:Calmodulin-binding transcription activator 3 [Hordeum vulgare]|nr:Calmodulin-binding transcription activator 3 [Hordeum vulgare]
MADNGSESFISRSVGYELVPSDPKKKMAASVGLRRSRKAATRQERSDIQHQESIACAQSVLGSSVVASSEAVRSV